VVERTIGNGEVESSILSGGTISFPNFLGISPRSGVYGASPTAMENFDIFPAACAHFVLLRDSLA
jgi:hypothetical protein